MHYFVFNDINSNDLDIIVKDMPLVPLAERDIESISVSGRNGDFHIDNGTYRSKSYTISCIVKDISKIDLIKSIFVGSGKLVLSKYGDRYFIATIKNQVDFEKYLNVLHEFPLQFELHPIAYNNSIEILEFNDSNSSFDIGGNVSVGPTIIAEGTGIVTINNVALEVEESGIEIDCDLMNCTLNGLNANDKVILDEFPRIKPKDNSIVLGGGITKVILNYRKGWL